MAKRTLKRVVRAVVMAAVFVVGLAGMVISCSQGDVDRARMLTIQPVDLRDVPSGVYEGSYAGGSLAVEVETTVRRGKITKIRVLTEPANEYQRKARGVILLVILRQSLDVDAVSGATGSSKAILKAVENSLKSAPR
jgi:uncharacterized protein with FMN-binding domain